MFFFSLFKYHLSAFNYISNINVPIIKVWGTDFYGYKKGDNYQIVSP